MFFCNSGREDSKIGDNGKKENIKLVMKIYVVILVYTCSKNVIY